MPAREPAPPTVAAAQPEARSEPESEPPEPQRVTIGAGGDVLVHIKVARAAAVHEGGFAHVFGELSSIIGDDEIAFVNLETPLSIRVPPVTGDPPLLGAPPEVARALAEVGVDVASVANNHAYDQTARGLEETLAALAGAGIAAVGAAATPDDAPGPVVIERAGVRVAFLAFTERINRGPVARDHEAHVARFDRERAAAALARARERAQVVVVSIHWSHDFYVQPLRGHRALARWLVEQGADVILGHGPHVLQEVERLESPRGEALCAYSLGNLVSNQGLRWRPGRRPPEGMHPAVVLPETRDGAWLRARFALEGDRVRVEAVEAVPLWTHNNHFDRMRSPREPIDIRVRPLRSIEPTLAGERRPIIERTLGGEVQLVD